MCGSSLNNYYNPEKKHAAEKMRKQMTGSILDGGGASRRKQIITQAPSALPAPVPTAKTSKDRLRELKDLLDDGLITSDEYKEKRKAIINGI